MWNAVLEMVYSNPVQALEPGQSTQLLLRLSLLGAVPTLRLSIFRR